MGSIVKRRFHLAIQRFAAGCQRSKHEYASTASGIRPLHSASHSHEEQYVSRFKDYAAAEVDNRLTSITIAAGICGVEKYRSQILKNDSKSVFVLQRPSLDQTDQTDVLS